MDEHTTDDIIQLTLLPGARVPECLRLDPETCQRGRAEIARIREQLRRQRRDRHAA